MTTPACSEVPNASPEFEGVRGLRCRAMCDRAQDVMLSSDLIETVSPIGATCSPTLFVLAVTRWAQPAASLPAARGDQFSRGSERKAPGLARPPWLTGSLRGCIFRGRRFISPAVGPQMRQVHAMRTPWQGCSRPAYRFDRGLAVPPSHTSREISCLQQPTLLPWRARSSHGYRSPLKRLCQSDVQPG